ncbi:Beige/BEACH domain containing protein [Histomonas meleagridis]|uniref:Beige/BEACH domain containing protein n=1 Tax=Histomonas meleagridis TaxID=135588 RepID=UPI003559B5C4|nr:Beige/BEACH domain containing protein [Histomonas meleagridis]KAH0798164.1 Beige/BEACH domain containing protein [Histomonas meleagridis]
MLHLIIQHTAEFSLLDLPKDAFAFFKNKKPIDYSPKTKFLFDDLNLQNFLQEWLNGEISSYDFLLKLNYIDGRYSSNLIDDENGIIFPSLYTETLLNFEKIYPFNICNEEFVLSFTFAHFTIPEVFKGNEAYQAIIENRDEITKTNINLNRWISNTFKNLLTGKKIPLNQPFKKQISKVYKTENCSTFICQFKSQILPKSTVLRIQIGGVPLILEDSSFLSAVSINSSMNGNYLVIDHDFGVSSVYRVLYKKKKKPFDIMFLNYFVANTKPSSAIDETDYLCATSFEKKVVLWDFIRSVIIKVIEFDEIINGCAFDEDNGYLWCWSENTLFLCSVNGTVFLKTNPQCGIDRAYGASDKAIMIVGKDEKEFEVFYGQSSNSLVTKQNS